MVKVDISDVVAVRRFFVNSTKFPLTVQGQANADVPEQRWRYKRTGRCWYSAEGLRRNYFAPIA